MTGVPSIASIGPIRKCYRLYFQSFHSMESQGIRTIWGSSRKHPVRGLDKSPLGMNLQNVPVSTMEPGNDNDFVASLHSMQPFRVCWKYLEQGIRRTFCIKQRGIFPVLNFRSNNSNRLNGKHLHTASTLVPTDVTVYVHMDFSGQY
jgi:hypothetical protein